MESRNNEDNCDSCASETLSSSRSILVRLRALTADLTRDRWMILAAVVLIVLGMIATGLWRSANFDDGSKSLLIAATITHVIMGTVFLLLLLRGMRISKAPAGRSLLLGMIVLGAFLRLTAAPAAPAWEDDFYRYLWDGAVVSEGINPYAHPPEAARSEDVRELSVLAAEARIVHERINHPHLRTIYPPLAQASFFIAHQISPWSIDAWRFVVLVHDVASFVLLLLILRTLGLPLIFSAIYWINPLLVKEFYQAAHMDALLLPWLLGAILLAVRCRPVVSMAMLAGAVAVKFWPAMLAPILLRRVMHKPAVIVIATIVLVLIGGTLLAAMLLHEAAPNSGLTRYAEAWQNNAGFYALHHAFWQNALPLIGIETWHSQMVTRWATAILLVGWIAVLTWPRAIDGHAMVKRCLLAVAALFLISPTQFPWYFVWLVPLLAVWPVRALLLYTALLPLYHLNEIVPWVVWVQHVPVWGLLIHDGLRHILRANRSRLLTPTTVSTSSPEAQVLRQT